MRAPWFVVAPFFVAGCVAVEPPPKPTPPEVESEMRPEPAPQQAQPTTPPPQRPPAIVVRPSEVETLVAEFQRLRKLPAPELAREQDAARQALAQSRSDGARLRYAMTLALPGSGAGEDARALEVLEPVVKNGASSLNGLAVLLASYIQEHRRLGTQVQALQQKLDALRMLERSLSERSEGTGPRRK